MYVCVRETDGGVFLFNVCVHDATKAVLHQGRLAAALEVDLDPGPGLQETRTWVLLQRLALAHVCVCVCVCSRVLDGLHSDWSRTHT